VKLLLPVLRWMEQPLRQAWMPAWLQQLVWPLRQQACHPAWLPLLLPGLLLLACRPRYLHASQAV